jgi:hypothetical protein
MTAIVKSNDTIRKTSVEDSHQASPLLGFSGLVQSSAPQVGLKYHPPRLQGSSLLPMARVPEPA